MKLCLTGRQVVLLTQWHSSGSDPVYAVGSRAYSKATRGRHPDHPKNVCLEISQGERDALLRLVPEMRHNSDSSAADRRLASSLLLKLDY